MKRRGTYTVDEVTKTLDMYWGCYERPMKYDDMDEYMSCILYICDKVDGYCANCIPGIKFELVPVPIVSDEPQRYYLRTDGEYRLLSSIINIHQHDRYWYSYHEKYE